MLGNENADIGAQRLIDGNDDDRVAVAGVLGHGVLCTVDRVDAKGGLGLNAQLKEAIGKVLAAAEDHLKADPVDAGSGAVDVAHAQSIDCRKKNNGLIRSEARSSDDNNKSRRCILDFLAPCGTTSYIVLHCSKKYVEYFTSPVAVLSPYLDIRTWEPFSWKEVVVNTHRYLVSNKVNEKKTKAHYTYLKLS